MTTNMAAVGVESNNVMELMNRQPAQLVRVTYIMY